MNCEGFETIINNLTRAELADAGEHQSHLVHTESCPTCAALLADRRALGAGLRALAIDSEAKEAPPQVEAALLSAFRQQVKTTMPTAVDGPPAINVLPFPAKHRRTQLWALAAAATLLVIFALGILQFLKRTSSESPRLVLTPSPVATPEAIYSPPATPKQFVADAEIKDPDERKPAKQRKKPVSRKAPPDRYSVVASFSEFTALETRGEVIEIATDFLPMMQGFDSEPLESGQLIRVQMPRTALASFGLPVNLERANDPVKADVLLAEDGSARAIRFVR